MQSIEAAIAATPMFRALTPEQISDLALLGEEAQFTDGAYLMNEGDPAD